MWDKHSNGLFKKLGLEHGIHFQASQTILQLSKAVKFDSLSEDYIDKNSIHPRAVAGCMKQG